MAHKIQRVQSRVQPLPAIIMELDTNFATLAITAIAIAFAPISIIAILKSLNFKN